MTDRREVAILSPMPPPVSVELKTCTKCGLPKPIDEFGKDRSTKDGRHRHCKLCVNTQQNAYRHANGARAQKWSREYRERHPEKAAEANRNWEARHKAERAAYHRQRTQRPEIAERRRELARKRRAADPEKARAKNARWRERNREAINQRKREAYKASPIPSLRERFEAKLWINEYGCWIWRGVTRGNPPAPYIQHQKRQLRANRLSYEWHVGPIPDGHELIQTCANTQCVRPEHLKAVTRAERIRRDRAREIRL